MKEWYISGNVPSLKNSKIMTKHGLQHSKTVSKYIREKGIRSFNSSKQLVEEYKKRPNIFKEEIKGLKEEIEKYEKPVLLEFYFVRDSRRKFDFCNATQIILDLLTAHRTIIDDNCDEILPVPYLIDNKCYRVDKAACGVYLRLNGNKKD